MKQECFDTQIKRLKLRFGEKAFDPEFARLVGREVWTLNDNQFVYLVDVLIGSRPHSRPPTITDFREMRLQSEKGAMARNTTHAFESAARERPDLREVLKKTGFDGCESVMDAVKSQIVKNNGGEL